MKVVAKRSFATVPMPSPMGCSSQISSISCYDDVIFNVHYAIVVPIVEISAISLMGFNNHILVVGNGQF